MLYTFDFFMNLKDWADSHPAVFDYIMFENHIFDLEYSRLCWSPCYTRYVCFTASRFFH